MVPVMRRRPVQSKSRRAGAAMNNNNGWIKLHRRLLDSPRIKDPDWLAVWIHVLLKATHQPFKANFDGKIVELKPGQLISGRHAIAAGTGVHESKVKRVLQVMKTDQQIDQQAGVKGSLFTVRNWNTYQEVDQQIDQRVTSDRPASDQRLTTNKKVKNTSTQEHEKNSLSGESEIQFEYFWRMYPRKEGKRRAKMEFKVALAAHKPNPKNPLRLIGEIEQALDWQRELDQWQRDGGRWIPKPFTYLVDKRWLDERPRTNDADEHAKGF